MKKEMFFIWVVLCLTAHIVRFVYELLKYKKIIVPGRLSFGIVFVSMILLWISWFSLCGLDPYRIVLPGIVKYSGIALVVAGMILFVAGFLTIKSLESYQGDLMTRGIYAWVRHPMYLGFILWLIGFPVFCGAVFSFFLSLPFIANVLFWRYLEEKELAERFPAYRDYKKKTIF